MSEAVDWYTKRGDELRAIWPGVDDLEDDALAVVLAAARAQCEAFAPALGEGVPVPQRYRLAQAMQARALARAGVASTDGSTLGGYEGEPVTVFPMDWQVKALLRPYKGKPEVR